MRWKHHMSETWRVRMLHLWMADSWGDGCRTEHVCREGSLVLMSTSKSCVSHLRLWWLLFLMEKLRNVDVHVMEKEKPRSCSHTFRCPRALPCDTLSINCSFEGKRVSSMEVNWRNDMPCLIVFPRSCGVKKVLFLHRRKEETIPLWSIGEETPVSCEDRCCLQACSAKLLFPWSSVVPSTVGMWTTCWGSRSLHFPLVYSQNPLWGVNLWQRQTAVPFWSQRAELTVVYTTVYSPIGKNYGRHLSKMIVADPLGWCVSFLPSCDLIWLKDCLREEDWPEHQLGILSGDQLRRVLPCCSCIPASSRWNSSTNKANCFLFLTPQEGIHTVDIVASINPSRRLF